MTSLGLLSIFNRWHLKYLIPCIFIGICVFFLLPSTTLNEMDTFIPVDYDKVPAGLTMTNPSVSGVEIRISGPKSKINAISDLKLRYVIDLSGTTVGLNLIPINQDLIQLPGGVSIVKINPTQVTVKIENEIEKKLPVKIFLSNKPATGYTVSSTIARPLAVTLRGPETAISSMEEVPTKPIDIKGMQESFKKEIALDIAEGIRIVGASNIILAEILIKEKIATKKIQGIPVKGSGTPYVYKITPTTIDVEVKGPANTLDKLYEDDGINIYVDLQGLEPGVYIRRATIILPVKTTLIGVKPEIFTIKMINKKNN